MLLRSVANVSDIGLKNFLKGAQRDRDCRGRSIKRLRGGGVSSSVAPKRGKDLAEADERANNIVKGTGIRKSARRWRIPRVIASDARGGGISQQDIEAAMMMEIDNAFSLGNQVLPVIERKILLRHTVTR